MSNNSITVEEVEAFMAVRRKRGIAFPPAIERQFESDTDARAVDRRNDRFHG